MRILIAPGSYKGTLKSIAATNVIARAVREQWPNATVSKSVLADGGEGTIEMLRVQLGAKVDTCAIIGPAGRPMTARRAWLRGDIAVLESCEAVGFSLLSESADPFRVSSEGLGHLIEKTVRDGAETIMVGMGDSAVMDVGVGMLSALGVRFFTLKGEIRRPSLSDLGHIIDFDTTATDRLFRRCTFVGLVDTNDYLCGSEGQVALYGAQKGLKPEDASRVEAAISLFAEVVRTRLGVDLTKVVRASGSGGVAAALHAFLRAKLLNTLDYMSQHLRLDDTIQSAELVITGEGCLDQQTKFGKVPYFIAQRAAGRCVAIVGRATPDGAADLKRACAETSIIEMGAEAMRRPREGLRTACHTLVRCMEAA